MSKTSALNEQSKRYVMRKDKIVAELDSKNRLLDVKANAPYHIKNDAFELWEQSRQTDVNRTNLRYLRRMLGLGSRDTIGALKKIHYASLFDTFWVKEVGSTLAWEDVKFTENPLFLHALCRHDITENLEFKSPEHSTLGSFEKGWKIENGSWYLYKTGKNEEIWSELFSSRLLGHYLGEKIVNYWLDENFIVCESFINQDKDECLEHYHSIGGEDTEENKIIEKFTQLGLGDLIPDVLQMLYSDALVLNGDRHEFNFGIVNSPCGIRFAPLFDWNMSMIAYQYPKNYKRHHDVLIKGVKSLKIKQNFEVSHSVIETIYHELAETGLSIKATKNEIVEFILSAQDLLRTKNPANIPPNLC